MATPHQPTARWLVGIFHQYSVYVEQWRVLAESKALERDQYKRANDNLQTQLNETICCQRALQEVVDAQQKAIISLEYELAQATQLNHASNTPSIRVPNAIHRPSGLQPPAEPVHPPLQFFRPRPDPQDLSEATPSFPENVGGYVQSAHRSPGVIERPTKKMRTDDYIEVDCETPPTTQVEE